MVNNVTDKLHRAPPSYNFAGAQVPGPRDLYELSLRELQRPWRQPVTRPTVTPQYVQTRSQTNLNLVAVITTSVTDKSRRNAIIDAIGLPCT